MANATGVFSPGSALERNGWVKEGLIQAKETSFWSPFTGNTASSVVYQKNMEGAKEGNRVTFDFDGNYASKGFLNKETAFGRADSKKKFTSGVSIDRIRYTVDNGDAFDGKAIDDLKIAEHTNSRGLLSENFIRSKDQYLFNAAQGQLRGIAPSHIISPSGLHTAADANITALDDKWTFDFVQELSEILASGEGFAKGDKRRPLDSFNGKHVVVLDSIAHLQLLQDPAMRTILSQADVRGMNNMLIKGYIGEFGNLIFTKAPNYFGQSAGNRITDDLVEIAGMKKIDSNGLFSGDANFDAATLLSARSFVMGANAFQFGMGRSPDYKIKFSQDFDIKSESALETFLGVQKTQLLAENDDYVEAKVGGMDYGVIAIDSYAKN